SKSCGQTDVSIAAALHRSLSSVQGRFYLMHQTAKFQLSGPLTNLRNGAAYPWMNDRRRRPGGGSPPSKSSRSTRKWERSCAIDCSFRLVRPTPPPLPPKQSKSACPPPRKPEPARQPQPSRPAPPARQ